MPIRSWPARTLRAVDEGCATEFIQELAGRLADRVQLTTDGYKVYLNAIADASRTISTMRFCTRSMAVIFPKARRDKAPLSVLGASAKQSLAIPTKEYQHVVRGAPESHHADADAALYETYKCFLEEIESHIGAISLHYVHYNFCRIRQSLRGHSCHANWNQRSCVVGGRTNLLDLLTQCVKFSSKACSAFV